MLRLFLACLLGAGQKIFVVLLLLHLVAPVVHPIHAFQMGARDEARFHLDLLHLLFVLIFLQLLRALPLPFYDLELGLLGVPHLLDVFHTARMPYFLV